GNARPHEAPEVGHRRAVRPAGREDSILVDDAARDLLVDEVVDGRRVDVLLGIAGVQVAVPVVPAGLPAIGLGVVVARLPTLGREQDEAAARRVVAHVRGLDERHEIRDLPGGVRGRDRRMEVDDERQRSGRRRDRLVEARVARRAVAIGHRTEARAADALRDDRDLRRVVARRVVAVAVARRRRHADRIVHCRAGLRDRSSRRGRERYGRRGDDERGARRARSFFGERLARRHGGLLEQSLSGRGRLPSDRFCARATRCFYAERARPPAVARRCYANEARNPRYPRRTLFSTIWELPISIRRTRAAIACSSDCISSSARWLPAQRCTPWPKPRWSFASRVTSNRSGPGYRRSSRLAAAYRTRTRSPAGITVPSTE